MILKRHFIFKQYVPRPRGRYIFFLWNLLFHIYKSYAYLKASHLFFDKSQIEEGQTMQWPKEKWQTVKQCVNDLQNTMQKTKDWAKRIQLYAIIRYDQKQKIEKDESSYKPSSGTIKNKRLSKTNPTISHHQVRSKTKDWAKRIQLYAIIRYDQKQKIGKHMYLFIRA